MAFSFPAARQHDIMVGCDPHATIVLPLPTMSFTPHVVGAKVQWVKDHGDLSPNVFINGRQAANQFHDIKYLIPHIPFVPNILLFVIIPFSSSKIMLGSGTVLINGKPAGVSKMLTLNCGDPCSFPTGGLIPLPPVNVLVGVSWWDLLIAIVATAAEMLLSWFIGEASSFIGARIAGAAFNRVTTRFSQLLYSRLTARFRTSLVQRFSRLTSRRFVTMAEREVTERVALLASREVVEETSFLFTRGITTNTVDAFYERSVREAATVITENFGFTVASEFTETVMVSSVQQTIVQMSSEAANEIADSFVSAILGMSVESPLQKWGEEQAINISSGHGH